ncbi:MAG: hypothetical protein WKG07_41185 [Hymenobacter sp.]
MLLGFLLGRLRELRQVSSCSSRHLVREVTASPKAAPSSLLLVLAFRPGREQCRPAAGLAGCTLRHRLARLRPNLAPDLHQLQTSSAESAFLIRTFSSMLFGYSICPAQPHELAAAVSQGLLIVGVLTAIRYVYLRYHRQDGPPAPSCSSPQGPHHGALVLQHSGPAPARRRGRGHPLRGHSPHQHSDDGRPDC